MKKILLIFCALFFFLPPNLWSAEPRLLGFGFGSLSTDILPSADDTYDLGSSSLKWKDAYIDGVLYADQVYGVTYGSDGSITDAELKTLDDGATTEILVGGGAGSAPVWTTATGSGSPVRGTSPTIATPTITFGTVEKSSDSVSLSATECSGTLITNRGWDGNDDQTFTLPTAAAGLKFKFMAVVASGGTADTYFDTADGTTQFYLDGIAIGDGERIWTQEIAVGESIVFHTFTLDGSAWDWAADSINGVYEDKGS